VEVDQVCLLVRMWAVKALPYLFLLLGDYFSDVSVLNGYFSEGL
jgi:hypothetical protein